MKVKFEMASEKSIPLRVVHEDEWKRYRYVAYRPEDDGYVRILRRYEARDSEGDLRTAWHFIELRFALHFDVWNSGHKALDRELREHNDVIAAVLLDGHAVYGFNELDDFLRFALDKEDA